MHTKELIKIHALQLLLLFWGICIPVLSGSGTPSEEAPLKLNVEALSQQPEVLVLPPTEGAWLVKIATGGGLAGKGMGDVMITSQGDAATREMNEPTLLSCKAKISSVDLRSIEQRVLSAKPSAWKADYGHECCDQFEYKLALHRRTPDGAEQVYSASWSDSGPSRLLPKDLVELVASAWIIKKGCRN